MLHSNSQDCVHTVKTGISIQGISLRSWSGLSIRSEVSPSRLEEPGAVKSCLAWIGSYQWPLVPDQGRAARQGHTSGRHLDLSWNPLRNTACLLVLLVRCWKVLDQKHGNFPIFSCLLWRAQHIIFLCVHCVLILWFWRLELASGRLSRLTRFCITPFVYVRNSSSWNEAFPNNSTKAVP